MTRTFYEFFAGGGMARAGLGSGWSCLLANDFNTMKAAAYGANWGERDLICDDVARLRASELAGTADLAWASFPCQDLSLAGGCRGFGEEGARTRSGAFWPFWRLMGDLADERRAPRLIVLENVYGAIASRQGRDFDAICSALADAGHRFGALLIDAVRFVPQSRPRLFFIVLAAGMADPPGLYAAGPVSAWHPRALIAAQARLPTCVRKRWIWWNPPTPPDRNGGLADLIDDEPDGVRWHSRAETLDLLALMSPVNCAKLEQAKLGGRRLVGGLYKRTRTDENGVRRQRAEARFDDIAGCLRTPAGGSSRQTILVVEGKSVRSRLLSAREAARLMGLPDTYILPSRYNDAYRLVGDGVCVSVVRHIADAILEPTLDAADNRSPVGRRAAVRLRDSASAA